MSKLVNTYLKATGACGFEEAGLCAHYELVASEFMTVADDCKISKTTLITIPRAC